MGADSFAVVTSWQQKEGSSLTQSEGLLRIRAPLVPAWTTTVQFRITASLGSASRDVTFLFEYLPVLVGPSTVQQHSPMEIYQSEELTLWAAMGNMPRLTAPFQQSAVVIEVSGQQLSPTAIVLSTATRTELQLAVPSSVALTPGTLSFSIYSTSRGVATAATIDVTVLADPSPLLVSSFPSSGQAEVDNTVAMRLRFLDLATTSQDISVSMIYSVAIQVNSMDLVISQVRSVSTESCTTVVCSEFEVQVTVPMLTGGDEAIGGMANITVTVGGETLVVREKCP